MASENHSYIRQLLISFTDMKGLICFSFIAFGLAVGNAAVALQCYNCADRNPCAGARAVNQYYYPNDDPRKFVQCSEWGQCYVMPCAGTTEWDVDTYTCNRHADITRRCSSGGGVITPPPGPGSGSDCVSFSVALNPNDFGDMNEEHGRVFFDRIIANNGGHYDVVSGSFIAPSAGAYFFSITAQFNVTYIDGDEEAFTVRLYQNNNIIVVAVGDDGETHSASSVINLAVGDVVYIDQDDGKLLQYTTFTGFKLCCGC